MSDKVELVIDGNAFTGWKSVKVHRSLDTMCGSFEIGLADQLDGKNWSLSTQKNCFIRIGSDRIMTGFIDAVRFEVGSDSHQVTIRGRDVTADLVDCAVVSDARANPFSGPIVNSDAGVIIKRLATPFGLGVSVLTDVGARFARFAIQKGETVFETIDRACKQRGVIAITSAEGNLLITVPGDSKAEDALRYGVNIESADGDYDYTSRFSHYRVEEQSANEGEAVGGTWGRSAGIFGTYTDGGVNRFRPTVVNADANATKDSCKKRAAGEALFRAANSQSFEVTVVGWRQSKGALWRVNQVVSVDIPALYVKEELLVTAISYSLAEDGAKTTMTLNRKDAFNTARALAALEIKDPAGTKKQWH